jgi:holo-[acyl-carrier protein] synthase
VTTLGVGIDVVDVARVKRLIQSGGGRALERLLTDAERSYCLTQAEPARHVAVRVAAKEAAFKAFQSGGARRMIGWQEIEVQREPHGEPTLLLHGRAQQCASDLHLARALVSLSHSHNQAVAVVLLLA